MKLSEHFELSEFTASAVALSKHIKNVANEEVIENLKLLCENVLEPVREMVGRPIIITSGYRCPQLNKAVGGSKTSQHMFGQAADIIVKGVSKQEMYYIGEKIRRSNIVFDQMIFEGVLESSEKTDWKRGVTWLHISYRKGYNRKQVLYM